MRPVVLAVGAAGAAVVLALAALLMLGSAPAGTGTAWNGAVVPAPRPDLPDDPAAVAELTRAVSASASVGYSGVAVVRAFAAGRESTRSVNVVRAPGTGTSLTVLGKGGKVVGSQFSPDEGGPTAVPGDAGRMLGLVADNYGVGSGPPGSVAGRPASVVVVQRASAEVAARFWIDRQTGLVLQRELYDNQGDLAQSAAFQSLSVGTPVLAPELSADAVWTHPVDDARYDQMRASGWTCPAALPFGLSLYEVREGEADGADVLQMIYSDGLTTVSLFEQRGSLDGNGPAGFTRADMAGSVAWTRTGPPTQVVWQSEASVFTLVSDAPDDLVRSVVAALPGNPVTADGWSDRIARGWGRVVDGLSPWS
ncbi:MAG: hypothetical protein EPO13_10815 [Actinomycetota bacterium]|nr:MAG: hypothetical protein EPO13_10815 [Actinomycetota bacterium]